MFYKILAAMFAATFLIAVPLMTEAKPKAKQPIHTIDKGKARSNGTLNGFFQVEASPKNNQPPRLIIFLKTDELYGFEIGNINKFLFAVIVGKKVDDIIIFDIPPSFAGNYQRVILPKYWNDIKWDDIPMPLILAHSEDCWYMVKGYIPFEGWGSDFKLAHNPTGISGDVYYVSQKRIRPVEWEPAPGSEETCKKLIESALQAPKTEESIEVRPKVVPASEETVKACTSGKGSECLNQLLQEK